MQIVKLLEDGIKKQDWGKICEAYESLTGDTVPKTSIGLISKETHDLVNLLKENPDLMKSIVAMITNIVLQNMPSKTIDAKPYITPVESILSMDDVVTEKDYKVTDGDDFVEIKEFVSDKIDVFGKKTKVIAVKASPKGMEEKKRMLERKTKNQSSKAKRTPIKRFTKCVECNKPFEVFNEFEGGDSTLCKKCLKNKKVS